jgi:hypothetical protein
MCSAFKLKEIHLNHVPAIFQVCHFNELNINLLEINTVYLPGIIYVLSGEDHYSTVNPMLKFPLFFNEKNPKTQKKGREAPIHFTMLFL